MADEELEALRKQRLAELQAKHGVSGRPGPAAPRGRPAVSVSAAGEPPPASLGLGSCDFGVPPPRRRGPGRESDRGGLVRRRPAMPR